MRGVKVDPERFGLVDVFWAGERVGGAWEDGVLSPSCGWTLLPLFLFLPLQPLFPSPPYKMYPNFAEKTEAPSVFHYRLAPATPPPQSFFLSDLLLLELILR